MVAIIQSDHPTLRAKAEEVLVSDIATPKMQKVLADMRKAMYSQDDAVAIAAPQIDVPLRIFIISEKIGDKDEPLKVAHTTFINPVIVNQSKKTEYMEEGCLSVRWKYGKVARSQKATVRAFDENGKAFTYGASGLVAQIFQHEIDHLDGVLFTDKAIDVEDMPPEGNLDT